MIFCGLLGATCGGLIIDHFKLFKEVAVVSFSLALLCLIWFVEVSSVLSTYYSGFLVGCPKIATRICACAHSDGEFELKIMRMRGFSSQFLDNQPENRRTVLCKLVVHVQS